MGETGPCGPCSEIHIDRGAEASQFCPHPPSDCGVNVDGCARYIELGNLVFIQYNRDASGKLTPLPMKHVDTGTGLERVTSVLQSIETGRYLGNYDIDLFERIIRGPGLSTDAHALSIEQVVTTSGGPRYGQFTESDVAYRAIADHTRAIAFLISDGVLPGNTDRGYVLRRLIRRAMVHARGLDVVKDLVTFVCCRVAHEMSQAYPELLQNRDLITETVSNEENQFRVGIRFGLDLFQRLRIDESRQVSGETAFRLHDTFGFPIDVTQMEARRNGLTVDMDGFNRLMEEQRERGRAARKDEAGAPELALDKGVSSRFVGGHSYEADSEVLAAQRQNGHVTIVTGETPFYPEGGGQIGDRGVIETESGGLLEIFDTRKQNGSILHLGRLLRGDAAEFDRGRHVTLRIDRERRDAAMRNHSATHILHYALREIRGTDVHQAGSLVEPGRLRFDFSHQGPIGDGDLQTIEEEINARIRENADVATDEMAYDDAIKAGALAFFGDKYGDRVRVVRMGDFSVELCGGTHVNRTGDIGLFKLEAESGVAAGVRRIEAFTGQGALESIRRREKILNDIGSQLGARDGQALERLERILAREKELEKKLRALEQKLVAGDSPAAGGAEQVREVKGIKVVTRKFDGVDAKALREIADRLRDKYSSAVVALGSKLDHDKAALLVAVTADLSTRIKAGDIVKQVAPIIGGTGGGRPDFAQAGGRDASKLNDALDRLVKLVGGD
jgi:alanyl-tRNA synthetase